MSQSSWQSINALKELEAFTRLPADIEAAPKRWKEWCEFEKPEQEKLPQDWKSKTAMQRLCIMVPPPSMVFFWGGGSGWEGTGRVFRVG